MKAILPKLLKLQDSIETLKKDGKNPFFKSNYTTLTAVLEEVKPELTKLGLVLVQGTVAAGEKNFVRTAIYDSDSGECIDGYTEVIFKTGDAQNQGSGISYARRYGLMSLLALSSSDDDGAAASGRVVPKQAEIKASTPITPVAASTEPKKPTFRRPTAPESGDLI